MKLRHALAAAVAGATIMGGGIGAAVLAPTAAHASTVLLGTTSVLTHDDSVSSTQGVTGCDAEAFGYTASATGTAADVVVYMTTALGGNAGIYADSSGKPGALLASGSVTTNTANSWVTFALDSTTSISSGTQYWIAVSPTAGDTCGTFGFRDTASGNNKDWVDTGDNMPSTYDPVRQFSNGPASMYVTTS